MNIQVNEISETKSFLKFKFWCKPPSAHNFTPPTKENSSYFQGPTQKRN